MSVKAAYEQRIVDGDLRPDAAQAAAVAHFDALGQAMATQPSSNGGFLGRFFKQTAEPPKGLYFWGGVGRGKSMLMDLFFETSNVSPKRRVHFHAFMQGVHARLGVLRKTGMEEPLVQVADEEAAQGRLLCFDELQITDITDAMLVGRLFELLRARGVVMVITSNRVPDDLYKDGLNRALFLPFIDFLKDQFEVLRLDSQEDYRQAVLRGREVYHAPIGADATAALDAAWNDLANGPGEPLVLEVNKREVVLPAYRDGVARASFDDLCSKPLGPGDYLAVAQSVRVLILADIPELSVARANEAKRFVTLIDALYEANVRLICSAAAEPDLLYPSGTGAFEFVRTASRLQEMRGEDWATQKD